MAIKYDKLVRDRIPEIIRESGRRASTRIADGAEILDYLVRKIGEEAAELQERPSVEELADLLEVVHALARELGVSLRELETARRKKAEARGGFGSRVILQETD